VANGHQMFLRDAVADDNVRAGSLERYRELESINSWYLIHSIDKHTCRPLTHPAEWQGKRHDAHKHALTYRCKPKSMDVCICRLQTRWT